MNLKRRGDDSFNLKGLSRTGIGRGGWKQRLDRVRIEEREREKGGRFLKKGKFRRYR